jgi:hypothetical protein
MVCWVKVSSKAVSVDVEMDDNKEEEVGEMRHW